MANRLDPFGTRAQLGDYTIYRLDRLAALGVAPNLHRLPFSIKILLEAVLRNLDGYIITEEDVKRLAAWTPTPAIGAGEHGGGEIPFMPARVVMQDFTGVPCVVDLAAMREAMKRLGGDPKKINPLVSVDLVIDHSVQVDFFGSETALIRNAELEFQRNRERYEFLKWGSQAFQNFRVVPPATGIVHQVNLEYLAQGVLTREGELFPDTLVGTDSHTTMINGLGVLGWGVGGIEAEAVMLGQPLYLVMPQVIGFKLVGTLREGVTATDLVLTVTQMLRQKGVVDKFVEFYGSGLSTMTLPDRATLANMAPEYGATIGFFPTDAETLRYLRATGRAKAAELLERYAKEQGLFRTDDTPDPLFTDTLELDLATVEPSLAGPKRPQDRVLMQDLKKTFRAALTAPVKERGYSLDAAAAARTADVRLNGHSITIGHGAVVIAAITSCTNTSNPSVMIGAGLLAKKAVEKGLTVKPYVKTSLAPGSKVVHAYLAKAGLLPYLEQLGFSVVAYGCTTCIGNSGPLPDAVVEAIQAGNLIVAAVLSGNRNFEGRVHPHVKANFLASPPLVVAYALAGTIDIDLASEPLGIGRDGNPVYLRDIWPSQHEIAQTIAQAIDPEMFVESYGNVFNGNALWNAIPTRGGDLYAWDDRSTYIAEPPYFQDLELEPEPLQDIRGARVLARFGHSITTDHISPAGSIHKDSPAGQYLISRGVPPFEFNQYGTRRGHHEVMMRGTFANPRLLNHLVPGIEGGYTRYFASARTGRRDAPPERPYSAPTSQPPQGDDAPSHKMPISPGVRNATPSSQKHTRLVSQCDDGVADGASEVMTIYDAAMKYKAEGVPLIIIAGKEYGTGSSRDWAAKGTALLGVKAVLAESFERIHRSNLVGMGVLPLVFMPGENADTLDLLGYETYDILGLSDAIRPRQVLKVRATSEDGTVKEFQVIARLDTMVEVEYYKNGGILQTVLRNMAKG